MIRFFLFTAVLFSLSLDKAPRVQYIETHVHLQATYVEDGQLKQDWLGTAAYTIKEMDKLGISKCLIMPPPQGTGNKNPYTHSELLPVVKKYPDRFTFLGGGGTLNVMIQRFVESPGAVPDKSLAEFRAMAQKIIDDGAVGFGEMTALHLSFNPSHPYVVAPPDHILFLELADIAAKSGLPIDLHMEAVQEDIPLPSWFKSPPNPSTLHANTKAFERLLDHNKQAKIVWQHVGWDNTGYLTIDLIDKLLQSHGNLYIGLKCLQEGQSKRETRPLSNGVLKKDWITLMQKYPDRFMLGSDFFYVMPGRGKKMPDSSKESRMIVDQLPDGLKEKLAYLNAMSVLQPEINCHYLLVIT